LADQLVRKYKQRIAELTLLPSDGGCFEIKIDDELVYSKLSTGSFPDNAAIESMVQQKL
jgi:selenoprotein W-related protein